jgi:hypothetical protein
MISKSYCVKAEKSGNRIERNGAIRPLEKTAYLFGAETVRAMDCVWVTLPETAVTVRV